MENEILNKIDIKMSVVIGMLMDINQAFNKNEVPDKEKFKRLSELGLSNEEIGKIFNKSAVQVSKQIYETKRIKGNK